LPSGRTPARPPGRRPRPHGGRVPAGGTTPAPGRRAGAAGRRRRPRPARARSGPAGRHRCRLRALGRTPAPERVRAVAQDDRASRNPPRLGGGGPFVSVRGRPNGTLFCRRGVGRTFHRPDPGRRTRPAQRGDGWFWTSLGLSRSAPSPVLIAHTTADSLAA